MTSSRRSSIHRVIALAVLGLLLPSCTWFGPHEQKAGEVVTVRYYWLDQKDTTHNVSDDFAIPFERMYLQWNAYKGKELAARQGHYYAITWKAADHTAPVTVRLEYRQEKTGLSIHTQDQVITDIHKSNITRFRVVSDEYVIGGKVICFRISLIQNKHVIGQRRSYLWEKFDAPPASAAPSVAVDAVSPGTSEAPVEPVKSPEAIAPAPSPAPAPEPAPLPTTPATPPAPPAPPTVPPAPGEEKLPKP